MRKTNKKSRLLLSIFAVVFAGVIILNVFDNIAKAASIKHIELNSNASFANHEEGAWKIDETATILSQNKIQVKYDVDSILKGNGKRKDIFVMTDISGSMTGQRINHFMSTFKTVFPTLINEGNRVAVGYFSNEAALYRDFTDDGNAFAYMHETFPAPNGGTSYYKAFRFLNEFFANYTPSDDSEAIVLFLTDGVPFEDSPLERAEYQVFKNSYPFITVQGIQYELGDSVIPGLVPVSDNQFVSREANFEDVLFEASYDGYKYDEFRSEFQLNNDYYEVESATTTMGSVDAADGKVVWNMDGQYRSGTKQSMTVTYNVKDECFALDDARCKVNDRTIITSKIKEGNDEHLDTSDSVIIQFKYNVSYDFNTPAGCTIDDSLLPAASKQIIYSTVGIDSYKPTCEGFEFKAWTVTNDDAVRVNDDYFVMPEGDTIIRALWGKPTVSKTMDGTIAPTTTAMLKPGRTIGYHNGGYSTERVKTIAYSDMLPIDFTPNSDNTISTADSELPIYTWYDDSTRTAYFYSDADIIYMNPDSNLFLVGGRGNMLYLDDISGLSHLDASKVKYLKQAFSGTYITDLSPISDWDVSSVEDLSNAFSGSNICDYTPLANWDVSSVKNMYRTFASGSNLCRSLAGLENWDVSNVEYMTEMFAQSYVEDFSPLANWDVSNVTSMEAMFVSSNISSVEPFADWDTGNVTNMIRMFESDSKLTSLHGLENWDTKKVTTLQRTFAGVPAASLAPLADWDVSSVQNMERTFCDMRSLTSLSGLEDWDVSSVTDLTMAFENTYATSLQPLADWDVSKVQSMHRTFLMPALTSLDGVEDWVTAELRDLSNTFYYKTTDLDALENWDVRKVTTMRAMLAANQTTSLLPLRKWKTNSLENIIYFIQDAPYLTSLAGLDDWDVSKVRYATEAFCRMPNVTTIEHLADWNTVSLQEANGMFHSMSKLTNLHGLETWKTGALTNINTMFAHNANLENLNAISSWRLTSATNVVAMFQNDTKLTSLEPIRNLGLGNATSLANMFTNDSGITDFEPLSGWDVSKITSLERTFSGTKETNLNDLSGWDVSKITSLRYAFSNMTELTSLTGLSSWSMPNLESIEDVFDGDVKVTSLNGIQSWGTVKLQWIGAAFYNMTALTDISALASWDVSNVRRTSWTFSGDSAITSVEALRNWNVESVVDIKYILDRCTGVRDFTPLENWHINSSVSTGDRNTIFAGTDSSTTTYPTWY